VKQQLRLAAIPISLAPSAAEIHLSLLTLYQSAALARIAQMLILYDEALDNKYADGALMSG
jgi:hypothetical protein